MLTFATPYLETEEASARVLCYFEDDERKGEIFFEVPSEYGAYLCDARSDAYVIAALPYAMRTRQDIICDAPVTENLLFQIETELVPAMSKKSALYPTKIFAATAPVLPKKSYLDQKTGLEKVGAVGTGFSLGTDSFYAVATLRDERFPHQQLTHLAQHDIGAFNNSYRQFGRTAARDVLFDRSRECAAELDIPLLQTKSNLKASLPGDFELIATFNNIFATYCMQEFWESYHLGSHGCGLTPLIFDDMESQHSAFYDILTLECLSIPGLRLYSSGMSETRMEKIWALAHLKEAQTYLHVCSAESSNCMKCEKCKRTLVCLDILDRLDLFSGSFDVAYYREHRLEYLAWLCKIVDRGNLRDLLVYESIYEALTEKEKDTVQLIRKALDSQKRH